MPRRLGRWRVTHLRPPRRTRPSGSRYRQPSESRIGRETHAVRKENALVSHTLVAFGVDQPDLLIGRIAEVDLAARIHREVIGIHTLRDHRLCARVPEEILLLHSYLVMVPWGEPGCRWESGPRTYSSGWGASGHGSRQDRQGGGDYPDHFHAPQVISPNCVGTRRLAGEWHRRQHHKHFGLAGASN